MTLPIEEWFRGRSRVLFVHAHPDDESISTGGTIAALAEAGREPLLITLTRGERGEVMPGPLQAMVQAHGLAVVRQNELKTAIGMLGLDRHVFLGVEPARAEDHPPVIYEDSGMEWADPAEGASRSTLGPVRPSAEYPRAVPAENVGPDALTSVPASEVLNDLLTGAYLSGAQGIVSYDDGGGYGHPDHVLAHRISRAVATALGLPFWEIVSDFGAEDQGLRDSVADNPDAGGLILDDANEGDTIEAHDIEPWYDRKVAALRAYATQLTVDGDEIVHVGGQRQAIDTVERFRLRLLE